MQSAEHIATAIDYDKVFWWTPYKGYEVVRGETPRSLWKILKQRGIHHLHLRLLMNNPLL